MILPPECAWEPSTAMGSLDGLMIDAVSELLSRRSPVRDTGDLRADLEDYARGVAEDLSGAEGKQFLRLLAAVRLDADSRLPSALVQRFGRLLVADPF